MKRLFLVYPFFILTCLGFAAPPDTIRTTADKPVFVQDELIVVFDASVTPAERAGVRNAYGLTKKRDSVSGRFTVYKHANPHAVMNQLRKEPGVILVEQNAYAYADMVPNDPYYGYQWHMEQINVEAAWENSTGAGAVVAVIDTGVKQTLEDLQQTNFVPGYDFVNSDTDPKDDEGHGSHVAGTIAQSTNNGIGVAGVAFGASIMPVKVLDRKGSGTYDDIADGIRWATDAGADVINMSLGGTASLSILEEACNYAWENGVVIVCAAGNDNTSSLHYPSAYPVCISVSACTSQYERASYSNYGSTVDITAPGGDSGDYNNDGYDDMILQNTFVRNSEGYYFFAGTSMASPHVAGVAALVKSKNSSLSNAQIRAILESTADDLGNTDWDGAGLVNAAAAVAAAGGGGGGDTTPPVLSGFAESNITTTGATITWLTDELANSVVDYGVVVSNETMTTNHTVDLTGLTPDTTYTYVVRSTDAAGNTAESGERSFKTLAQTGGDGYMYVAAIDMSLKHAGPNTNAIAVITILDNNGNPVSGATVTGDWAGAVSGSGSGITGTDGTVTLQSPKTKSSGTPFTFTIVSVSGSITYDPSYNLIEFASIDN